jgi:hypothetical protein
MDAPCHSIPLVLLNEKSTTTNRGDERKMITRQSMVVLNEKCLLLV